MRHDRPVRARLQEPLGGMRSNPHVNVRPILLPPNFRPARAHVACKIWSLRWPDPVFPGFLSPQPPGIEWIGSVAGTTIPTGPAQVGPFSFVRTLFSSLVRYCCSLRPNLRERFATPHSRGLYAGPGRQRGDYFRLVTAAPSIAPGLSRLPRCRYTTAASISSRITFSIGTDQSDLPPPQSPTFNQDLTTL